LLPHHQDSDIAQKHPASTFTFTMGRGGQWNLSDEGVTDMTSAIVNNMDEIQELTIDELDEAAGGSSKGAWIAIGVIYAVGAVAGLGAAAAIVFL
jgi:hypothetical protein